MAETFTCASCGGTFSKGWSDEEAAAEAKGLFPGIDASDPAEAGVVCDDCYRHIMGRVHAEAPEAIGARWREYEPPACYRAAAGFMVHVKPGCRC